MAKKILVSNIDPITSEDDLYSLFADYGDVDSVIIRELPDPDKDTFTGEILMDFEDEADQAVRELDGEQIDGRWLYVRFAEKDRQKSKTNLLDIDDAPSPTTFEAIQKKKRRKE